MGRPAPSGTGRSTVCILDANPELDPDPDEEDGTAELDPEPDDPKLDPEPEMGDGPSAKGKPRRARRAGVRLYIE